MALASWKPRRKGLGAWLAMALCCVGPAAAEQWNMPTPYADNNFHTVNILRFADEVKQATGGALEIIVHSNGSLFHHPEIKRAVQTGQVPIGEVLMSALGNEDPIYEVDSVPFLARTHAEARKLWQASQAAVTERLAKQGLKLLLTVPWPPQQIFARRQLNAVEDFAGLKFRVYNAMTARLGELMGTLPTNVQLPDVPQAFATGLIEAMVSSSTAAVDTQAWDFLTNGYLTNAWLPKNIVVVNERALKSLDPALQTALLTAAAAAETRGWQMSERESAEKTAILVEKGIAFAEPSAALMQGLLAIGATMSKEWAAAAGADGAAILDAYRGP